MIKATFNRNGQGQIISFEITGHAGFGEEGFDIVCAAVSSLSINAINSIEQLAKYQPIVDAKEGYLFVEMLSELSASSRLVTDILLKSLEIGLKSIESEYSEYIRVN